MISFELNRRLHWHDSIAAWAILCAFCISWGPICASAQEDGTYLGIKGVKREYVPVPNTHRLSEEAHKEKAIVEKLDKKNLLYTGKVMTDQDKKMLSVPKHLKEYEGEYFTVAKTAPEVEFGVMPVTPRFFPEPVDDHHRAMWASWCQSAYYAPNGNFYTAIGDNGSYNAHLYLIEYDTTAKEIRPSAEVNEVLGRPDHVFSEGKIHGCLDFMDGPYLWYCTYWSKYPEVHEEDFATGYKGGHIMSYNVETHEFFDFGVPMPRASWPGNRVDTKRRMLYAVGYDCEFLAWDIEKQQVNWAGMLPDGMVWSNRVFLIDEVTGKVYTCNKNPEDAGKHLIEYDPVKNKFRLTEAAMPAIKPPKPDDKEPVSTLMRAVIDHRAPDGLFYGVTHQGELFAFRPETEEVKDLGINWPGDERYTTSMQISPGGRYIYYAPGAHGHGNRDGSPLVQYDRQTGKRKVLAFFTPYYFDNYGYTPSGAFSIRLDDQGESLFICWNGGFFNYEDTVGDKSKSLFAHNSLMVVHIPESERQE